MDYKTRLSQAKSFHLEGICRVVSVPEPQGQKFPIGSRVWIGKMPPYMSHFEGECEATVLHTYAHAFGGDNVEDYCLDVDGHGEISWYEENQLTEI